MNVKGVKRTIMFVRAYLRASTQEQNAERARQSLIEFATSHNLGRVPNLNKPKRALF